MMYCHDVMMSANMHTRVPHTHNNNIIKQGPKRSSPLRFDQYDIILYRRIIIHTTNAICWYENEFNLDGHCKLGWVLRLRCSHFRRSKFSILLWPCILAILIRLVIQTEKFLRCNYLWMNHRVVLRHFAAFL